MSVSAAELLVACLAEQECNRVFTVPGESFLPVLDALHGHPTIQTITCRQEGGAAFMACADGAITGRPGVGLVNPGPRPANPRQGVQRAIQD
jgi:acetolactate synthase-1/2/3 large subunit